MKKTIRSSVLPAVLTAALLVCARTSTADDLRAFPGAEGFGTMTHGGRGGEIIAVTNLNPDGEGSFRAAIEAEGPRIIVFSVGGTIELTDAIGIDQPFATIAGQTAPGDGICIRGAPLYVSTNDVIVRGLRFYIGDDPDGPVGSNRDGLVVASDEAEPFNVVIDHCSIFWAIDENLSTWYPCHDITVQWCITAEALADSLHEKGVHSMGFLIGDATHSISVHHNLFALNNDRNPLLKADVVADVVNNVIYNWGGAATGHSNYEGTDLPILANIVSNLYIEGADSTSAEISFPSNMPPGSEIYVAGNIGPNRPDDSYGEWALCDDTGEWLVETPHDFEPVRTWTPQEAYDLVLENAGARAPRLCSVDERVLQSVRDRTGNIIDSQDEVGGWPACGDGTPPADTDGDGIPDDWESDHGLDPSDPSDSRGSAASGYMWIEEYINSLIPVPGGEEPLADEEPDAPPDASTDDAGVDGTPDAPVDVAEEEGAGDEGDEGCGCRIAM